MDGKGGAVEVPGGGLDQVGQDYGDVRPEERQLLGECLAHAATEPETKHVEIPLAPCAMQVEARLSHPRRVRGGIQRSFWHGGGSREKPG